MDATCKIQDSILVFSLVRKYVSRILGTYHTCHRPFFFWAYSLDDTDFNMIFMNKIS